MEEEKLRKENELLKKVIKDYKRLLKIENKDPVCLCNISERDQNEIRTNCCDDCGRKIK